MNRYQIGDNVRLQGTIADAAGAELDPSTITVKVRVPAGTISTFTYPATVDKSDTGVYSIDFSPTESGTHAYRFVSTGTGQAAAENVFFVENSRFD